MVKFQDKVRPKNKEQLKQIIRFAFDRGIYDLNFIDTSSIIDMAHLFISCEHNFDVSEWDISNVTDMSYMFCDCTNFNCDLSNWDVSNVAGMGYMFNNCERFKGKGLEKWDVSNVTNMRHMFDSCKKSTIPSWYKE